MSVTKQKSSAGKNVLIFFVVFIILEMLIIFGVGKVFKNKDVTPSVAGYSLYIMDSDKMGTKVPQGSLVIAANGTPSVEKIGQAVVCENVEGVGTSVFWLAGITSKAEGQDGVIYTVVQENDPEKYYDIKSSNIVGIASSYYMTAGMVISFITSKFGMIVCAIVPVFLLVLIELIIAIATHEPEEEEEEEEEEEQEANVKLDDFLFGGRDEGEQIARARQRKEQQALAQQQKSEAEKQSEEIINTDGEGKAETEESEQPQTANAVDSIYYEKASRLLDEAADETENDEAENKEEAAPEETHSQPVRKPQQRPARPRPARPSKSASASLEELMKLMEEEQNKLRKKTQ